MQKVIFHIKSHFALEYDNNYIIINEFIKKRVNYFFPDAILAFDSLNGLIKGKNNILIELLSINPLFDPELIKEQIDLLKKSPDCTIKSKGHIPGSEPKRVYCLNSLINKVLYIKSNKQQLYNSQLNLNKLKRQKHFKHFLRVLEDFHKYTLEEFFKYIESEEGIKEYSKFGEDVELVVWDNCPYCVSTELEELYYISSQPMNGFVTKNVSLYSKCNICGLVFLKRAVYKKDLFKIYDDYMQEFSLHRIKNKDIHVVDKHHMFYKCVKFIEKELDEKIHIVDLGCGGGEFLFYVKEKIKPSKITGIDFTLLKEDDVKLKSKNINTIIGDFKESIDLIDGTVDLFTMWYIVEHLDICDLESLFLKIESKISENGFFCFCTPDFDNILCRLFDFALNSPIQHLTVLSEKWLETFIVNSGFKVVLKYHQSMMFRDESYTNYCSESSPNLEGQNIANILTSILSDSNTREKFREILSEKDIGEDIVYILQKA
jgi:SAM-dependent methyltransferase